MKYYQECYFDDAKLAFSALRKSCDLWGGGSYIFRGQSNSKWPLEPGAWRSGSNNIFIQCKKRILDRFDPKNEIIDKILSDEVKQIISEKTLIERIKSYIWQITCELYLTHEFIHRSNMVGLEINKPNPFGRMSDFRDIVSLQLRILYRDEFGILGVHLRKEESVKDILDVLANENFDFQIFGSRYFSELYFPAFALAQHHGIPTRFLDWTRNPLKALFFALDKSSDNDIAVFALNSFMLNREGVNSSEEFPHSKFTFLHKQEGVFVYLPCADGWYLRYGVWPSIEEWLKGKENYLTKITISAGIKNQLLDLLEREDINKESLMPTYNHAAESTLANIIR